MTAPTFVDVNCDTAPLPVVPVRFTIDPGDVAPTDFASAAKTSLEALLAPLEAELDAIAADAALEDNRQPARRAERTAAILRDGRTYIAELIDQAARVLDDNQRTL